jgi:hypothetical protein
MPSTIPKPQNNEVTEVEENFEDDAESLKEQKRRRPRRKRRVIKPDVHQHEFPLNENLVESETEDANPRKKTIYQLSLSNNEKDDEDEPSELRKLYPETYKIQIETATTVGAGKMLKGNARKI